VLAIGVLVSCRTAAARDAWTVQVSPSRDDFVCHSDMYRLTLPPPVAPDDLAKPFDNLYLLDQVKHNEYARTAELWIRTYAWPMCGPDAPPGKFAP
jgi:hypothetical protein